MSLGKCCVAGFVHGGEPTGKMETINGALTYVALPANGGDKTKALLFFTDVFGMALKNNKLISDQFAANGFATFAPAYLNGDDIPQDALNSGTFDLMEWLSRHSASETRPVIDKLIAGLKSQGYTSFAATGYCYGARYTVDLVVDGILKVAVVSHPSLLEVPKDLEAIKAKSIPFLWNTCETDFMFGPDKQAAADVVFKGDKNYRRDFYPGMDHGFAVRGDLSNPAQKLAIEKCFKETVDFLGANF